MAAAYQQLPCPLGRGCGGTRRLACVRSGLGSSSSAPFATTGRRTVRSTFHPRALAAGSWRLHVSGSTTRPDREPRQRCRTGTTTQSGFTPPWRATPGPFGHTRALVLSTSEQEFVLFPQRGSDHGDTFNKRMQEQASVLMHYAPHRPAEYRNGMLKSAYLAASLHLGGVPNVPSAA